MIAHHRRTAGRIVSRGPRRRERGSVLVEMAFVAVFLCTLAGGAYDYGMGWRSALAVTEGARTGARVGSSQGNAVGADFASLSGMRSALSSSGLLSSVTRVVIYQASTAGGDVPSNCKTTTSGSISDKCNILTGDQFRAMPSSVTTGTLTATGCITNSQTKQWCPTTRNDIQITADYVGVWVQVNHVFKFKFIGSSRTIERDAVMRIEPTES